MTSTDLKQLRIDAGLTLKDLAALTGIKFQNLSLMESGTRPISATSAFKVRFHLLGGVVDELSKEELKNLVRCFI